MSKIYIKSLNYFPQNQVVRVGDRFYHKIISDINLLDFYLDNYSDLIDRKSLISELLKKEIGIVSEIFTELLLMLHSVFKAEDEIEEGELISKQEVRRNELLHMPLLTLINDNIDWILPLTRRAKHFYLDLVCVQLETIREKNLSRFEVVEFESNE